MSELYQELSNSLTGGNAQAVANKLFNSVGLPASTSTFAGHIVQLAEDDTSAAASLMGIAIGAVEVNLRNRSHLVALGRFVAWDQTLSTTSVDAARKKLLGLLTEGRNLELGLRGRIAQLEKLLVERNAYAERAWSVGARFVAHKVRMQRRADEEIAKSGLKLMEDTKALYMEHMALSAPVEYWKRKATSHRVNSNQYRTNLLGFSIASSILLLFGLYMLAEHAIAVAVAEKPAAVYFILATIGVVMSTIVFWVARILTRLFLSEMHLAMDSEERATMVETYLALTSVSQATPEDRAIVLASLFRPTADGIVKDDGAPDMSPAGLVSRVLTPR